MWGRSLGLGRPHGAYRSLQGLQRWAPRLITAPFPLSAPIRSLREGALRSPCPWCSPKGSSRLVRVWREGKTAARNCRGVPKALRRPRAALPLPLPAPQPKDSSLAALMGDQGPNTALLLAQAWSPVQEGQVEPASEASLPSLNSPKIPEAWLSYPGNRPALLAGSKDGGSKRAGPRPSPTGVTMLRPRASLPLSRGPVLPALRTPQGAQPLFPPPGLIPRSCWHVPPVPAPCGSPAPCPGDAGRAPGLTPSPACLLTHSLWLPGQNCAQAGGAWQPGSFFSLFCTLSGASRLQPTGRPLPRLPHRAWTG